MSESANGGNLPLEPFVVKSEDGSGPDIYVVPITPAMEVFRSYIDNAAHSYAIGEIPPRVSEFEGITDLFEEAVIEDIRKAVVEFASILDQINQPHYFSVVERNDHEGETWTVFIPATEHNLSFIEPLQDLFKELDEEEFRVIDSLMSRSAVKTLTANSGCGYFPSFSLTNRQFSKEMFSKLLTKLQQYDIVDRNNPQFIPYDSSDPTDGYHECYNDVVRDHFYKLNFLDTLMEDVPSA